MSLCKHGKKSFIAFVKYFSKIIRQMKENAIYSLLGMRRYFLSDNQNVHLTTHNQSKLRTLIKTHLLTNERARSIPIIL